MAEEFEESEVIFQEDIAGSSEDNEEYYNNFPSQLNSDEFRNLKPKRKKLRRKKNSVPVSIPENAFSSWNSVPIHCVESDFFDDGNDDGEMVPPHVIIGRRVAGKRMTFSVCTGNGRTLKGRDLSEVRNSILRMTGFLET